MILAGQLVLGVAMPAALPPAARTPVWPVPVLPLPLSVDGALVVPALTALLMGTVPPERTGTASGLLNSLRQSGGAPAVALLLLSGRAGDFSLPCMRLGLPVVAALVLATAALSRLQSRVGQPLRAKELGSPRPTAGGGPTRPIRQSGEGPFRASRRGERRLMRHQLPRR